MRITHNQFTSHLRLAPTLGQFFHALVLQQTNGPSDILVCKWSLLAHLFHYAGEEQRFKFADLEAIEDLVAVGQAHVA